MTIFDTLKKQIDPESASGPAFEEVYKSAYSHGLEAIYALENVDLKSIKRMHAPENKESNSEKSLTHSAAVLNALPAQLEFDLGEAYRNWIESFLVREPVQVLGLSRHAEKCLLERGKAVLKDLIGVNLRDFAFIKGMGQGHIDEVQQKLNTYLEGRVLGRSYTVDFYAWIRSLVAALDTKKTFVGLERFELSEMISLSPSENVEVRRLTLEKKQEWCQEITMQFCEASRQQTVAADMSRIADVFVKPWMRGRLGLATQSELMERLEQVSEKRESTRQALAFFSATYFDRRFPLDFYLYRVVEGIYCIDEATANNYHRIVETARSYFYKTSVEYPLEQLITLLMREFSSEWRDYNELFLTKVLRHSAYFCVRKGMAGQFVIHLR